MTTERPSFQDIVTLLSLPDTKLLKWSEEDKSVYPEATTLGADLLCGEGLYKDLQTHYQGESLMQSGCKFSIASYISCTGTLHG